MARIDTLNNFLTDVADAIREKTGDENPINASDFDIAISNIKGGLDIQNGRKVNYKSYTGIVPAGTFIKLKTSYNKYTGFNSTNDTIRNMLDMGNFVILGRSYGNNPYYFQLIAAKANESGFTVEQRYNVLNGQYTYGLATDWLMKINDTHFCHFIKVSNGTDTRVKYAIYRYENNVLEQVTSGYITPTETELGVNDLSTSYPDIMATCVTETETDAVMHFMGRVSQNDTAYKGFVYGIKINKTDLTVTYMPNNKDVTKKYGWNLVPFKNTLLIAVQANSLITVLPDYQNNTYTFKESTFSNYNFPTTAGKINYLPCLNNSNALFLIVVTSNTTIKYTKVTVDSNNKLSGNGYTILDEASSATYNNVSDQNTIINGNKLVFTFNVSGRIIENVDDNTLRIYPTVLLNDSSPDGTAKAISTNNVLLIKSGNYSYSSSLGTRYMYVCTAYIDGNNMINQNDGSAITVEPATGSIQGLTNEECTTTTAGEVILLNT